MAIVKDGVTIFPGGHILRGGSRSLRKMLLYRKCRKRTMDFYFRGGERERLTKYKCSEVDTLEGSQVRVCDEEGVCH